MPARAWICVGFKRSHLQMSMPKNSGPEHGGRHSLGLPGTQTSQKQHARLLELETQPSAVSIRLP